MSEIVNINHEPGDLSQYDSTSGDDVSVSPSAQLVGHYGLKVVIDDTTATYGQVDFSQLTGTSYRVRFYIDPNSLTMGEAETFLVFQFYQGASNQRDFVNIRKASGVYQVRANARIDAGSFSSTALYTISDEPHYIEYSVTRASSAVANDGTMSLWIDGEFKETVTGLDIFNLSQADNARLGAVLSIDAGTNGTFYLDDLVIRDDNQEIGAARRAALDFYLVNFPDETLFTADVASTPSDPYIDISYSSGVTGSFGNPLPGMTVLFGDASDPRSIGDCRLRTFPGGASGTIRVNENDDVTPQVEAGDKIRIINQFRLWPKYPRFLLQGEIVTIFEDYDEAFSNQTNQWRPKAVAGPPGFAMLEGGSAGIRFVGDRSQAIAPGASITNYLWTARGSTEGTSTSQGTEASPVIFTWTSPGRYLVTLQVTDSNGQTDTQHTWAIVENPDNRQVTFIDFDTPSDNYDFLQGGGECSFVVRGDASTDEFPEESAVMLVSRGDITTPTGSWPFRTNVLFSGWILTNSVRQNPDTGEVSFRAATIDAIMKNLSMFPASLTFKDSPTDWTQARQLTVDRSAHFLYLYRSTLGLMTPVVYSGYDELIQRQDFGPGDLYNQVQNELMRSIYGAGKVVSTHQGVLYHVIDYNIQLSAERTAAETQKRLHKGVWVNDVFIEERQDYSIPVSTVKMSGVHYPGGDVTDVCPLFSEAPGDAPKVYGKEQSFDRLIVESQSALNVRCGLALAKLIERHPVYRMQFVSDGSFSIVPQDLFPATIESGDNDRELSYTGNLIARRMNRQYNHQSGYYIASIDFEPETTGPAGATVDMPCGPPEQVLPPGIQPEPPSSSAIQGQAALIAGTTGTSFYYAPGVEQTWDRRVSGLASDQLAFLDLLPDPWSNFKQGYNPDRVIVWGSGRGFLVRSADSGHNWKDRSTYLEPAPNWTGESGNELDSVDIIKLQASIFSEDHLYALGRWQYTGAYHGAIAKTEDGFEFDWTNIGDSGEVRPLGMSLDRGNGQSLFVTTWESAATGIYLRRYDADTMAAEATYFLGNATEAEVDANSYYATPFNRNAQTCEVFLHGRMREPQGFTGSVHVLRNTNCGATGSYSVIENTWATDIASAFGADGFGFYYAIRQSSLGGTLNITTTMESTQIITGSGVGIVQIGNFGNDDVLLWYENALESENVPVVSVNLTSTPVLSSTGEGVTRSVGTYLQASPITTELMAFTFKNVGVDSYISGIDNSGDPPVQEGNDATNEDLLAIDDSATNLGRVGTAVMSSNRVLLAGVMDAGVSSPRYRHQNLLYLISTSPSISYTLLDTDQYETDTSDPGWDLQNHYLVKLTSTKAVLAYTDGSDTKLRVVTTTSDNITTGSALTITGEQLIPALTADGGNGNPLHRLNDDTLVLITDAAVHVITVSGSTLTDSLSQAYSVTGTLVDFAIQANGDTAVGVAISVDTPLAGEYDLYATAFQASVSGIDTGDEFLIVDGLLSVEEALITGISNNEFAVFWYRGFGDDDYIAVMKIRVDAGGVARFYQGGGSLVEKFTLPFSGVRPAAFTLSKPLGTLVVGTDAPSVDPVVYSEFPYITGTSTSEGMPTGVSIWALKWI